MLLHHVFIANRFSRVFFDSAMNNFHGKDILVVGLPVRAAQTPLRVK